MSKWLSRKFFVVQQGFLLSAGVPVAFKHFGVSEQVTLASLALITLIAGYYFKVNKDLKVSEVPVNGYDREQS